MGELMGEREIAAQVDERLKSIQGKYEYDLSRYEAAQDEYRKAKDTFDTLDKSYHEEGFLAASAALCEGKQRESRFLGLTHWVLTFFT